MGFWKLIKENSIRRYRADELWEVFISSRWDPARIKWDPT